MVLYCCCTRCSRLSLGIPEALGGGLVYDEKVLGKQPQRDVLIDTNSIPLEYLNIEESNLEFRCGGHVVSP